MRSTRHSNRFRIVFLIVGVALTDVVPAVRFSFTEKQHAPHRVALFAPDSVRPYHSQALSAHRFCRTRRSGGDSTPRRILSFHSLQVRRFAAYFVCNCTNDYKKTYIRDSTSLSYLSFECQGFLVERLDFPETFLASIEVRSVHAESTAQILGLNNVRQIDQSRKIHPVILASLSPDHPIGDDANPESPTVAAYLSVPPGCRVAGAGREQGQRPWSGDRRLGLAGSIWTEAAARFAGATGTWGMSVAPTWTGPSETFLRITTTNDMSILLREKGSVWSTRTT